MIFMDTVNYLPYKRSIITENPYLITCYDRLLVWILDNGKWRNPDIQTFGASVSVITYDLLEYKQDMAKLPLKFIEALLK